MLLYRSADMMGWTKDLLDDGTRPSEARVDAHVLFVKEQLFTPSGHGKDLVGISVPANTNAQAMTARGSNFGIDPAIYTQRFTDPIHENGLQVLARMTDCEFEGLYSFTKTNHRNGNRFTYLALPITDTFSSSASRDHGYGLTSASGNLSSNYLTSHQGGNSWSIVSGELTGPAANGWVRSCLFNAPNLRNVTMVAKVKKVGHQQIIVRASTDSNFPGYGLQMRDTNVLRIERPGLASLGQTTKTWVSGNWYWLKLEATGTTIRGKAWDADDTTYPNSTNGSENEPVDWDLSFTDSTYTNGYCGFSGESSTGKFKSMTITPSKDTSTWIARMCDWIDTNHVCFETGDIIVPFPEASSHWPLTNEGNFNQFFIDLSYCIEQVGIAHSKTWETGLYGHIWTSVIQQTYNTQFSLVGIAAYDHYGASIGPGKRFGSSSHGSFVGSSTYALPSALSEAATDKCSFIPEKLSYNETVDVHVVDKGTGDWVMEIHDAGNNRVQMCDHTNFASKTTTGIVTVPNASLTNGQLATFSVNWDNPVPDVTYHLHLYSTDGTGTVLIDSGSSNDLTKLVFRQYKCTGLADALEIDIRKTYARTGVPQFLEEWGDYWSTDSSRSDPVRNQADHESYLDTMYAAFQRLVDDGILVGFNYWRLIGGHEGIMSNPGSGTTFSLLYEGSKLAGFFAANAPDPVTTPNMRANSRARSVNKTRAIIKTRATINTR